MSNGSSSSKQDPLWLSELLLISKQKKIPLVASTKKERQLWLAEFSRAIEWSDSATPAKVANRKVLPSAASRNQE
jgi:hypothetical protein